MTIKDFVRFEDIDRAYKDVQEDTENAFLAEQKLAKLEQEKADLWDSYVGQLEKYVASHYPNQASKDAVLRISNPSFMAEYDKAVEWLSVVKHSLAKAWLKVNSMRTMIELAKAIPHNDDRMVP